MLGIVCDFRHAIDNLKPAFEDIWAFGTTWKNEGAEAGWEGRVRVPEGVKPGQHVAFEGPKGQWMHSLVPEGLEPGEEYSVFVIDGEVYQQSRRASAPINEVLEPWLAAARDFQMNTDFEVAGFEQLPESDLQMLIGGLEASSVGTRTACALGDKILVSRMMDNLRVDLLPLLFTVEDGDEPVDEVESLVCEHLRHPQQKVVLKPSHVHGAGIITVQGLKEDSQYGRLVERTVAQVETFLEKESSHFVRPGCLAQPRYTSEVDFGMPLALSVTALWGRTRSGVWWWGNSATPQRTAWIQRAQCEDTWVACHNHQGFNLTWEKGLRLFENHMPYMADTTERIAKALGAPLLSATFFVGSKHWGVRLNSVSCCPSHVYCRSTEDGLVDDRPAMAQILHDGWAHCTRRQPAEMFLSALGVHGSQEELSVVPLAHKATRGFAPSFCSSTSTALGDADDGVSEATSQLHDGESPLSWWPELGSKDLGTSTLQLPRSLAIWSLGDEGRPPPELNLRSPDRRTAGPKKFGRYPAAGNQPAPRCSRPRVF